MIIKAAHCNVKEHSHNYWFIAIVLYIVKTQVIHSCTAWWRSGQLSCIRARRSTLNFPMGIIVMMIIVRSDHCVGCVCLQAVPGAGGGAVRGHGAQLQRHGPGQDQQDHRWLETPVPGWRPGRLHQGEDRALLGNSKHCYFFIHLYYFPVIIPMEEIPSPQSHNQIKGAADVNVFLLLTRAQGRTCKTPVM